MDSLSGRTANPAKGEFQANMTEIKEIKHELYKVRWRVIRLKLNIKKSSKEPSDSFHAAMPISYDIPQALKQHGEFYPALSRIETNFLTIGEIRRDRC